MNRFLALAALGALTLSACSGGGGSAPAAGSSTSRTLTATFVPNSTSTTQSRTRATAVAGTSATVSYQGATVGTGTVDANDRVKIALASAVPGGARVTLREGAMTAAIVLSKKTSDTISKIVEQADGSLHVTSTDDVNGDGEATTSDDEDQQDEIEIENEAEVRAVHASPDAGPVDIYAYPQGTTRPTTPIVKAAAYPQITDFLEVPAGTYTIDVLPAGAPSTASAVATENATVTAGTQSSIVVAGRATASPSTLQFVNFVEPAETDGQSALVVHHASPFVQGAIAPVAVGIYDDGQLGTTPPQASATLQLFTFSLTPSSGPISGGAFPGTVVGGEYFLSPIAGQPGEPTLPSSIGFAAGAPGAGALKPLGSVAVSANLAQLATGLQNPTYAQTQLAGDTASTIPPGAHLSIFAIDTANGARLIGTVDH